VGHFVTFGFQAMNLTAEHISNDNLLYLPFRSFLNGN